MNWRGERLRGACRRYRRGAANRGINGDFSRPREKLRSEEDSAFSLRSRGVTAVAGGPPSQLKVVVTTGTRRGLQAMVVGVLVVEPAELDGSEVDEPSGVTVGGARSTRSHARAVETKTRWRAQRMG